MKKDIFARFKEKRMKTKKIIGQQEAESSRKMELESELRGQLRRFRRRLQTLKPEEFRTVEYGEWQAALEDKKVEQLLRRHGGNYEKAIDQVYKAKLITDILLGLDRKRVKRIAKETRGIYS